MLCPNCKKQIPDDAASCPFCGKEIIFEEQLPREIKLRRWQRWIGYGLAVLLFLGMLALIIKAYNTNSKLLADINGAQDMLTSKSGELETAKVNLAEQEKLLNQIKNNLTAKSQELEQASSSLLSLNAELAKKADDMKTALDEKIVINKNYDQCKLDLSSADANIYGLIIKMGVGISNKDLSKIMVADANLGGEDADSDGLADMAEKALGTDPNKKDTDGDGFDDKQEILSGNNPSGAGKLPIDNNFASKQKGKILLAVEKNGEAWYVNPADGKRYFLGAPADAFKLMRSVRYWTKDWVK